MISKGKIYFVENYKITFNSYILSRGKFTKQQLSTELFYRPYVNGYELFFTKNKIHQNMRSTLKFILSINNQLKNVQCRYLVFT